MSSRIKIDRNTLILAILGIIGVLFVVFIEIPPRSKSSDYLIMVQAAELMQASTDRIKQYRAASGIDIDPSVDITASGLIGVELSDITTSTGDLQAKRTTATPDFAALMVKLLLQANVQPGDTIAIGASGSFPGALLATLAAAKVLNVNTLLIASMGSSNYGANIPDLNIVDMYMLVRDILPVAFFGYSLGGSDDNGGDMLAEGRDYLIRQSNRYEGTFILESSLEESISRRLAYYDFFSDESGIKAFINIGGAEPNIGEGLHVLDLKPGINVKTSQPFVRGNSVARHYLDQGIPVINILNIKTLALMHRLDWDPAVYKGIGSSQIYYDSDLNKERCATLISLIIYSMLFIYGVRLIKKNTSNSNSSQV